MTRNEFENLKFGDVLDYGGGSIWRIIGKYDKKTKHFTLQKLESGAISTGGLVQNLCLLEKTEEKIITKEQDSNKNMDIETILFQRIEEEVAKKNTENIATLKDQIVSVAMTELLKFRPIQIKKAGTKKVEGIPGPLHEMTDEVLTYIGARIPLLLVGPAGSGKTHIAITCAKALELPYFAISVNEQTSKSDFLGYNDANGELVETNFRKAFEKGGVFIIDEIDAGNPNILTVVNSALSNDTCAFPDGMVQRHPDFVCVCTANTFGEGESIQYIGRNILDAATRDRFTSIRIDYSAVLEEILVPNFKVLLKELREHFKKNNVLQVISTRAGLRLETLKSVKEKLNLDDIVACLNLHQEMGRDSVVSEIVKKYATA